MPSWFRRPESSIVPEREFSRFDAPNIEDGIGRRTISGAAVTATSGAIMFALQILQLAVLSRLLLPEDFGLMGMAMVATMFVRLFSDLGLPMATVQREEVDQKFVTAVFYIDLSVSLALMALCMALAPFAASIFGEPRVSMLIIVIALTFPLTALRGQHQALLTRKMQLFRLNLVNVSANALGAATAILCAWQLDLGHWSIAAGLVATSLATMILSWFASPWMPSRPGSLAAGRSAIGFGLNLLGANIAGWLWKQADRALIGWRWDAIELGYYTRAYSVLMVPISLISGPIGTAVIPALSRFQNDKHTWTELTLTAARVLAFFSGLLTVGLVQNAEFIIDLILGPQWGYSATIFWLLALSLFPSFVWEHARFVFISLGRTDTMRRYAVVAAMVHVAAFAIGVAWGAVGVAVSLAIASALVTPPLLVVSARVAGLPVLRLCAQFAPSFAAMLLVWGLTSLSSPLLHHELPIVDMLLTSFTITAAYCLVHLALLPFHEAWRKDAARIWGAACKFLARKHKA